MKYLLASLVVLYFMALALFLIGPASAQEMLFVSGLPPADAKIIVCDPEGDDGPTVAFRTDGNWSKAVGAGLWHGLVGQEITLGYAFNECTHVGGMSYGTDRLMFVLHLYDNVTKKPVSWLFIDFQEPLAFLTGPDSNEWIYTDWNCTHE